MSVVTFIFLLAVYFPFSAVCAPNGRADSLQDHVHARDVFEESTRSAIDTRATLMDAPDAGVAKPGTEAGEGTMLTSSTSGNGSLQGSAAGRDTQAQTSSQGALPSSPGGQGISSAGSSSDLPSTQETPPYSTGDIGSGSTSNVSLPTQSQEGISTPSGSTKHRGSSAGSNLLPYPSQGSPFSNATLPYQGNGTNGSGTNCPSQQTTTLPPVTVTLSAQTVTMTAPPETMTITVTPQTQPQTVTVTVTITAGSAAPYPTNVGNTGTGQMAASYNGIGTGRNVAASNGLSAAQSVSPANVQMTGQTAVPSNIPSSTRGVVQSNASHEAGQNISTIAPVPTVSENVNTQTEANQLTNQTGGGPVASSSSPQFFTIPPSLASKLNSVPIVSPNPARPPILTQLSSMSAASAASASNLNSIPIISPNPAKPPIQTQLSSMSAASAASQSGSGPSPSNALNEQHPAPYQNATGGSGSAAPSGGSIVPGSGPTASGAAGPTSGPTAPPQFSASLYQINAGIGNASATPVPAIGTNPAPKVNYTNTVDNGPVHPFTGLPPGPSIPPVPIANTSNAQGPPLSPFSPYAACSANGTITQNITANVRYPPSPLLPHFLHP